MMVLFLRQTDIKAVWPSLFLACMIRGRGRLGLEANIRDIIKKVI